jgi:hypothetical protein
MLRKVIRSIQYWLQEHPEFTWDVIVLFLAIFIGLALYGVALYFCPY